MTPFDAMKSSEDFLLGVARLFEARAERDFALTVSVTPAGPVRDAALYAISAGGKRLRPALVLAVASAFSDGEREGGWMEAALAGAASNPSFVIPSAAGTPIRVDDIVAVAAAFEYIHTYSLIHDDLPVMDNDATRRGRPSTHIAFGVETAVLAGALLIVKAFEVVAATELPRRDEIIAVLEEASGLRGMVGGQALDILGENRPPDLAELVRIHAHKTAALIRGAMRAGALAVEAGGDEGAVVDEIGSASGLAFQIVDDLLDVESTSAQMGKPVGVDGAKGKRTYPAVLGLAASRGRAAELTAAAEAGLMKLSKQDTLWSGLVRFVLHRAR
jgi:farnesyl diphosphate synthase